MILARKSFVEKNPQIWDALKKLEGSILAHDMIHLNGLVDLEKKSFAQAAEDFLKRKVKATESSDSVMNRVWRRTKEHVWLVAIALLLSSAIGVPLGILSSRNRWVGQSILLVSSMLQTIPSLALLCFLIPIFGIGTKPALVALFLYGLLPIVSGTAGGLQSIDARLIESARALGLTAMQRLRLVEFPLATPHILAGLRTSAIISIGTATLAALIGAGGYGAPIVMGLAMNDKSTILIGAIPAAGLALVVHIVFEVGKRVLTPRGLRSI